MTAALPTIPALPPSAAADRSTRPIALAIRLMAIFLLTSAGYAFWRGHDYIVWDDTSSASFNRYSNGLYYSWSNPKLASSLIYETFSHLQGDGYRPLSAFIRGYGAAWFSREKIEPLPFVVLNGVLIGLEAVLLWIFARRCTRTNLGADLVVFLYLASVPVLTAGLIISSGIHSVVMILMCGALLLYGNAKTSSRPWIWEVPLCLLLLVGPWFREFAGVTPLLILAAEALCLLGRRSPTILAIASIGFLHALFPTALVHFAAFPDLPVLPVYRLGNLANALELSSSQAGLLARLAVLHWRIFGDIVSVLPPSLFVIAGACVIVSLLRGQAIRPSRKVLFLSAFFALTFLPFLRTFHEQVHFAYCTIPLAILLMLAVESLWLHSSGTPSMRVAIVAVLLVPLCDHAINLFSVRYVTDSIYANIKRQAAWFTEHTPAGTVVMSNAHHLEDIRYYSGGHIGILSVMGGVPDRKAWVTDRNLLAEALRNLNHPLYCLDTQLTSPVGQRGAARASWIVRDEILDMEPVRTETIRCRYPFVDPLRLALPTQNLGWPGPPDLEFDFYRGPAEHHRFQFEVSLKYSLYAVRNLTLHKYSKQAVLLAQNVRGFNVIGYKNEVVAIPQSEGTFEPERVERCGYSRVFRGGSVEEVVHRIAAECKPLPH